MRFPISPNIEQVHFPPISEVKSWIAGRTFPPERPLVDLCQAIPDYPPAPELTAHLKPLLDDPLTSKYSPDEGLPEVRSAVSDLVRPALRGRPAAVGTLPDHRRQPGVLAGDDGALPGGR
jgi:aspartate/methionine/tyrosine aminotransferase